MNISRYFKLNRRGESQAHVVYAVTFTIIAVVALVGLIMVNTEADSSTQTATVENTAPVISNVTFGTDELPDVGETLSLSNYEGKTFTGKVTFDVTDNNGCGDIDASNNYELKIARSATGEVFGSVCSATDGLTGVSCFSGDQSQVVIGECNNLVTYSVTWPVTMNYFVDATDAGAYADQKWYAAVTVADDVGERVTAPDNFEVATLRALDVPASTNFGTLALGATSNAVPLVVKNTGNSAIDFDVYAATPMKCTQGEFAGSNVKITKDENATAAAATPMSIEALNPTTVNASLAKSSPNGESTTNLYAFVSVPSNAGVRGECSNTATYTAIGDGNNGI